MPIPELLVGKPVNHAVLGIELVADTVEILRIPGLVSPEYRLGDMVGQLDDARRPRIHE